MPLPPTSGPDQGSVSVQTRQQAAAATAAAAPTGPSVATAAGAAPTTVDAALVLKISDHLQLYDGNTPEPKAFFDRAALFNCTKHSPRIFIIYLIII